MEILSGTRKYACCKPCHQWQLVSLHIFIAIYSHGSWRFLISPCLHIILQLYSDDVFLGQYEEYADDETITNKDTNCEKYAMIRCFINNPRWEGVPIIFKAAKAVDERKAEMRIQFKDAPCAEHLFGTKVPRNEMVIKIQPTESMYMKSNIKTPGFSSAPIQSELEVKYATRYFNEDTKTNPDAYSRLILNVLRGDSASFVRSDELIRAWEIFNPVLNQIEKENIEPRKYKFGSRGVSVHR